MAHRSAVEIDKSGEVMAAAFAYEAEILKPEADVELFINLAVLYWCSLDAAPTRMADISESFLELSGKRFLAVLEAAKNRFGDVPGIKMWRLYMQYVTLGEDDPIETFRSMRYFEGLPDIGYVYLFGRGNDLSLLSEIRALLVRAAAAPTRRNRYIYAVTESWLDLKNLSEVVL